MNQDNAKLLKEISDKLQQSNVTAGEYKNLLLKQLGAFPPQAFKKLTKQQATAIKNQRAALQQAAANAPVAVTTGLAKFLGVDFKSEFFQRLKMIGAGFGEIKKGLTALGKALALDKIGKKVGGFWDFLKKLLGAGLVTVGILEFLEGWNKANEYFGENAGFSERLAAGIANVIGTFTGLTDGEIKNLAIDLNTRFKEFWEYMKTELTNIQETFRAAWPSIKLAFDGLLDILDGNFGQGLSKLTKGLFGTGDALLDTESDLLTAIGILAAIKMVSAVTSFAGAIGPIFSALATIGSGLGTIFTALGGKAAFTALMATLAPTLGSILVPLGLALAAVVALKSIFDGFKAGFDEFEKSGDISQALSAGLGGFVTSLLNMLTLGLLSDETLKEVNQSVIKFVDPIMEKIGELFRNIWNWVKDTYDDAVFAIKDFLGLDMTSEERYKKAQRDVIQAQNELDNAEAMGANNRVKNSARKKLEEAQAAISAMEQAKAIDNQILSSASSYADYIQAVKNNQQLTDEQKEMEIEEAKNAQKSLDYKQFVMNQEQQNTNIISNPKPQQNKTTLSRAQATAFTG